MTQGMSRKDNHMVGQKVEMQHDTFRYSGANGVDLGFELPVNAKEIEITIYDSKQKIERRMNLKDGDTVTINGEEQTLKLDRGRGNFHWNGKNKNEVASEAGNYRFQIRPIDAEGHVMTNPDTGQPYHIAKFVTGTLDSSYINGRGQQRFKIDGIDMPSDAFRRSLGMTGAHGAGPESAHPMPNAPVEGPPTFEPAEQAGWEERADGIQQRIETEAARVLTEDDLPPGLADI